MEKMTFRCTQKKKTEKKWEPLTKIKKKNDNNVHPPKRKKTP